MKRGERLPPARERAAALAAHDVDTAGQAMRTHFEVADVSIRREKLL